MRTMRKKQQEEANEHKNKENKPSTASKRGPIQNPSRVVVQGQSTAANEAYDDEEDKKRQQK